MCFGAKALHFLDSRARFDVERLRALQCSTTLDAHPYFYNLNLLVARL